jgi:hypothetical protein
VLTQEALTITMAVHVKKRSSSAKVNNVSKGIMLSSYGLYFKVIVIKHAKQTTVKQQENIVSSQADIRRWKQYEQDY